VVSVTEELEVGTAGILTGQNNPWMWGKAEATVMPETGKGVEAGEVLRARDAHVGSSQQPAGQIMLLTLHVGDPGSESLLGQSHSITNGQAGIWKPAHVILWSCCTWGWSGLRGW
jgi:hypothetical protein